MTEKQIKQIVEKEKVIAIVRGIDADKCLKVADALYAGGIRMMEVTFNAKAPQTDEQVAACIRTLSEKYQGRMLVGAGTVLNAKQVALTAAAGGKYIISPNIDRAVISRTKQAHMLSMPGALSPSEIVAAHEAGADFVKVFPVSQMGPGYIKAITAPLSHIKLLAVGGVNEKNLEEYLSAGMCGAGIGGNLANRKWIEAGAFDRITDVARELTEIAKRYSLDKENDL